MVLISDLAGLAAFGYSAWQIGGKWFVFRGKNERKEDDATLFRALEDELNSQAVVAGKPPAPYGLASFSSGQGHVFDSFGKLPLPLRLQFVDDMARIAAWSGQCGRSFQKNKVWNELSMKERAQLLGSLDSLSFDFVEKVKRSGAERANDAWLWQLDESLPLLALEPVAALTPTDAIKELQASYSPAEASITALLNTAVANSVHLAQASAEKPLAVTAATRTLQILRMTCEEELAMNQKSIDLLVPELKEVIAHVSKALVSAEGSLAKEIEAYKAQLDAKADEAAQAVRDEGAKSVVAASRKSLVASLVNSCSSKLSASTLSPGSIAKSNQVADQLASVLALLSELEAAQEDDPALDPLVEAARKLLPRFQSTLPTPPPSTTPPAADKDNSATNGENVGEDQQVKEQVKEEVKDEEVKELTLGDLVAQFVKAPVTEAISGVGAIASALISAATPLLPVLPSKTVDPSASSEQIVSGLVEGIFRRVKGLPEPLDYKLRMEEVADKARAEGVATGLAAQTKLEADASGARAKAYDSAIQGDLAKAKAAESDLSPAARAFLVSLDLDKLIEAKAPHLANGAREGLSLLQPSDLPSPSLSTSITRGLELSSLISLTLDVTQSSHTASKVGLELGPGLTELLTKLKTLLSTPDRLKPLFPTSPPPPPPPPPAPPGAEEEEANAVPPPPPPQPPAVQAEVPLGSVAKASALIDELLSSSLVLLELQPASYKKLQTLKESIEGLKPTGLDAVAWNKATTNIKEQVGQLGPIGAAVDSRLSSIEDQGHRVLLLEMREAAVDLYRRLQQLLADSEMKSSALQSLSAIKEGLYSLKVEKKTALLDATLAKVQSAIIEKAGKIKDAVTSYIPTTPPPSSSSSTEASPASTAAELKTKCLASLFSLNERSEALCDDIRKYQQLTRLREQALGPAPPSVPPDVVVPPIFPPLQETQVARAEEAVWLNMSSVADEDLNAYCMAGYKLVARGHVAVLLVCSPESADPRVTARVTADIGLPSTKSLLQIFAERIRRIQKLSIEALTGPGSGVMHLLPFFIMASSKTQEEALKATLADQSYYGLDPEQVVVFYPGDTSVPLVSEDGRIVMESPYKAARAQGGSGEIFRALSQSSITSKLNRMGIRSIDCHIADDNLLARTCDPTFIGYCHSIGLDCAAKVVDPDAEQMSMYGYCHAAGVLRSDGEVEIGPVSERMPSMVPCTGQYYLDMSWVNKVTSALLKDPLALYHLAPAALPPPAHKNHGATGYKFTRHLTDFLLPYSRAFPSTPSMANHHRGLVIVETADEFTLVWGKTPFFAPDSPTAAVEDLLLLHTHWVQSSGGELGDEEEGVVEVSPLVSYCGEAIETVVEEGAVFNEAYDLTLQGYGAKGKPGASFKTNVGLWIVPLALAYVAVGALKIVGRSKK